MTTPDDDGVIGEMAEAREHMSRAKERVRTGTLSPALLHAIAPIAAAIYDLLASIVSSAVRKIGEGMNKEKGNEGSG